MAGRDSLRSTIEELKDYTERINSRVTDDILLEAEDGRQAIGFTFQHGGEGGDTLTVLGVENEERIQVNYPFDLADALASDRLSEDEVTQDVFDREAQIARRDLATAFESKSEEEIQEYYTQLVRLVSQPEVSYELTNVGPMQTVGFKITRMIFPYDDDFGLRRYHRACQAVVAVGIPARQYILTSFNIGSGDPTVDSSTGGDDGSDQHDTGHGFY